MLVLSLCAVNGRLQAGKRSSKRNAELSRQSEEDGIENKQHGCAIQTGIGPTCTFYISLQGLRYSAQNKTEWNQIIKTRQTPVDAAAESKVYEDDDDESLLF